ncbi:hypothetical protein BV22DRAFT_1042514, partial [Leucogyrophana mollusca]
MFKDHGMRVSSPTPSSNTAPWQGSKHLINGLLGSTNKSGLRTADLGRIRRRPAVLVRISVRPS